MSKKDEALKLALEALAVKFSEGWHEGIKIDASDIMLLNDAAQALAEQPAQQALNKMAQNARDIGLDYEPSAGTQVSKVWRDGGKLVAKQVPLEDFYKPAQHRAWFTVGELNAWADKKLKENPQWAEQPSQQEPVKSGEGASATVTITLPAQQEPVVFYRCNGCGHAYEQVHPTSCDCMEDGGFDRVEYYTSPPAQHGQVAWTLLLTGENQGLVGKAGEKFLGAPEYYERVDVYTSPQRTWVGLTHDEIKAAYLAVSEIEWAICGMDDAVPFTRIIEAKLKEKNA